MREVFWLKMIVWGCLLGQSALIGISIWIIVAGEATALSYFAIAVNVIFAAFNIRTLAN